MENQVLSQGARLTAVKLKNSNGEEIGKVVEWMMDVVQGKVVYVIAALNQQEQYVAIPWQLMQADTANGGYTIKQEEIVAKGYQINKDEMNGLVNDKTFLNKLLTYYNLAEDQAQSDHPEEGQQSSTSQSNAEMGAGKGYGG